MAVELDIDVRGALLKAANIIRARIELQVPVKSGKLKASLRVFVQGNEIIIGYEKYGIFTNYGTGPYYNGRYGQAQPRNQYMPFRKGHGGVQARSWTSITSDDENQIDLIIDKELSKGIDTLFDKEFKNL